MSSEVCVSGWSSFLRCPRTLRLLLFILIHNDGGRSDELTEKVRTDERARTNCLPTLFTFTLHGACAPAPGGGGGGGPSFLHSFPPSFLLPTATKREGEGEG